MTKIGPGPPSPIYEPQEPPNRAQTDLILKIFKKFNFYDWNPHNFGRLTRLGEWQNEVRWIP